MVILFSTSGQLGNYTRTMFSRITCNNTYLRAVSNKRMASVNVHKVGRKDGHYSNVVRVHGFPMTVRRAQPEDHDAILAMDSSVGAYDSGDYLHGRLKRDFENPERISWVSVLNNKIIGFLMARYSDQGHHIVGRMARVDRSARSTGVWEALRYIGNLDSMFRWPAARMYFGCSSYFHLPFFQTSHAWKPILERPYLTLRLTKEETIHTPSTDITCHELSRAKYEGFMQDPSLSATLFPAGMVVVGREPFLIHPINFDGMAVEYDTIQASYGSGNEKTDTTSMSFGIGTGGDTCLVYDCAIYSKYGNPREFAEHLYTHIPLAQEHSTFADITLNVFGQFPKEGEFITQALRALSDINDKQQLYRPDMKLHTHTLGCVPLKSYLETTRSTLEEFNRANS